MSFADIKERSRQAVHAAFAVPCQYRETPSSDPVGLMARLHTRIVVGGAQGGAYATITEGVTRAIFNRDELADKTIVLKRNGLVTFTDYGLTFVLDVRDPMAGPVTETWSLAGT